MRIAAFRPLRYNSERISFISRVIAPPYDVIDSDDARELKEQDPHNVIRLVLGEQPAEGRGSEQYERAAETLRKWRREDVLIQEEEPCAFLCTEKFSVHDQQFERRGLLCVLQLGGPEGRVLPHEQTTSRPLEDRLRLMETCRANLSPVFGIFPDEQSHGDAALAEMEEGWPLYEFRRNDVICQVWRVTDLEKLRALARILQDRRLLIADGHHRFETATQYRRRHRDPGLPPGEAPEDYMLLYAVSARNSGLRTLATHRLVQAPEQFDRAEFLSKLGQTFEVTQSELSSPDTLERTAGELGPHDMACYIRTEKLLLLQKRGDDPLRGRLPEHSARWRRLPVTLLHYAILEPLLGIPADAKSFKERLNFTPRTDQIYWSVESGRFDMAFLLPPTPTEAVEEVAQRGEKMPPKSTYFYPKIPSGLAIYSLCDEGRLPAQLTP